MMRMNPEEISKVFQEVNEIDTSTQSLEAPPLLKNREETAHADGLNDEVKKDPDEFDSIEILPLPPEIPDELPKVKLKSLLPSLNHEFLGNDKTNHATINSKSTVETQQKLDLNLNELDWKEFYKLLDAGIIYSISDSKWVNPILVVPKNETENSVVDHFSRPQNSPSLGETPIDDSFTDKPAMVQFMDTPAH